MACGFNYTSTNRAFMDISMGLSSLYTDISGVRRDYSLSFIYPAFNEGNRKLTIFHTHDLVLVYTIPDLSLTGRYVNFEVQWLDEPVVLCMPGLSL